MGGYKYKPAAAGGGAAVNSTMTRVDITDGTWTLYDWQGTASSVSNTAGTNECTLDTSAATKFVDGAVWVKELKTADGSDYDFTDKRVACDFYIGLPDSSWADNGGGSGGNGNPPTGSRSHVGIGIMTDPENLPTSGSGPWPRDLLGCSLGWKTHLSRMYRTGLRNTSNSGTYGAISTNASPLTVITPTHVTAGKRATNRLEWATTISKAEHWAAGALDPAGGPDSYYQTWSARYDNGNRQSVSGWGAATRWGRTRTSKLYIFAYAARGSGATGSVTMKFDLYYNTTMYDGGTNPSGRTGLPA